MLHVHYYKYILFYKVWINAITCAGWTIFFFLQRFAIWLLRRRGVSCPKGVYYIGATRARARIPLCALYSPEHFQTNLHTFHLQLIRNFNKRGARAQAVVKRSLLCTRSCINAAASTRGIYITISMIIMGKREREWRRWWDHRRRAQRWVLMAPWNRSSSSRVSTRWGVSLCILYISKVRTARASLFILYTLLSLALVCVVIRIVYTHAKSERERERKQTSEKRSFVVITLLFYERVQPTHPTSIHYIVYTAYQAATHTQTE